VVAGITVAIAGCSTPLTTREKGAIAGGVIGAGAGAAIGSAAGSTATGALIGVGAGAASGALIGDAIQSAEQKPVPPPAPAPPPTPPLSAPPPPPPPPTRVVVASPPPVVVHSPQYVWVPEWGVYVLDGHDIAYHEGYHYYYYETHWYVARSYTGPWAIVASPPPALVAVPPGHFHKRVPPRLARKGMIPPGHRRYD
jgi:hypothetical protein